MREIDEWIRQGQGEDGQHFTPETCLHRVLFMGLMNEIPISSEEPRGGTAIFLQYAERNAACFARLKPGCFMYKGPGSEKTGNLAWYPDDLKRTWDGLAKQVTEVVSCTEASNRERVYPFPERRIEEKVQTCISTPVIHL